CSQVRGKKSWYRLTCSYRKMSGLFWGGFVALKLRRLELSNVRSTEANSGGYIRGVAQFGSAPALGAGGRRFKSCRPDVWGLGNLFKRISQTPLLFVKGVW